LKYKAVPWTSIGNSLWARKSDSTSEKGKTNKDECGG